MIVIPNICPSARLLTRLSATNTTFFSSQLAKFSQEPAQCPKPSSTQMNRNQKLKIETESPFKSSWFSKSMQKIGFGDGNIFALRKASIFHYQACTDKLDIEKIFAQLKLPDTLFSFFLVVQLHVWMCQVRSMKDGTEGRILRNEIVDRMWQDMDARIGRLDKMSYNQRRAVLQDLLFHHQGAIFSYDEGLLTDDKTLANAIWRTLFSKELVEPEILEMVVKYTRHQLRHLKLIGSRQWCTDGQFDWSPFPPLI